MFILSFKIPDVTERHPRDLIGRTLASNLVYTIWAVFGGFILHFLLSNYLKVLLRPGYEESIETAADLIKKDMTPFIGPNGQTFKQIFAASPDPVYQEISRRLVVAKNWKDWEEMVVKLNSTGLYADLRSKPLEVCLRTGCMNYNHWYMSSETIEGINPFTGHLANKKWPLKKVLSYS